MPKKALGRRSKLIALCSVQLLSISVALAQTNVAPNMPPSNVAIIDNDTKDGALLKDSALHLKGFVSATISQAPIVKLNDLVKIAIERDAESKSNQEKNKKGEGLARKTVRKVGDMAQFATACKGFDSSAEASNLILDEQIKNKGDAVEYVHQRKVDTLHTKLSSCMMQLCLGLGMPAGTKRDAAIKAGVDSMVPLVGEEESQKTLACLQEWVTQVKADNSHFEREELNILSTDEIAAKISLQALQSDEVVGEIKKRLYKYGHHSKVASASAKIINTTLSIAMFTPTIISPAAQVLQLLHVGLTGGPEEAKLLKEVYLDKRLESRFNRFNKEASLAVVNYNRALQTRNPALLAFSETLASNLGGAQLAWELLFRDATKSTDGLADLNINVDDAVAGGDNKTAGDADKTTRGVSSAGGVKVNDGLTKEELQL